MLVGKRSLSAAPQRASAARHWVVVLVAGAVLIFATAPLAAAHATQPASVLSAGSLTQVVLGLVVVLALVLGAARLARRFSSVPGLTAAGGLRVVGGAAVGQRERVVVVELGETWLVLGVAPGHVNALHTMAKSALPATTPASPAGEGSFAFWLRKVTERRLRD